MFTTYIQSALACAKWEILCDGSFFGSIPGLAGVYACRPRLDDSIRELQEVLEEWLLLGIIRQTPIPEVGGAQLPVKVSGS
jgi:predicted RNase H-like HicB family nuclease